MYSVLVFSDGSAQPTARHEIARAADVLTAIPKILNDHAGCEHVEVRFDATLLFSVDCHGNTIAG